MRSMLIASVLILCFLALFKLVDPRSGRVRLPLLASSGSSPESSNLSLAQFSYSILAPEIGLDPEPIPFQESHVDSETLLSSLQRKSGAVGRQIFVTSIGECLATIPSTDRIESIGTSFLLDEKGDPWLLLGRIRLGSQEHFPLIRGNSRLYLFDRQRMDELGFTQAWSASGPLSPVRLRLGSGHISVDRMYHNFGEILPYTSRSVKFQIANDHGSPIILGSPTSSCGCTAATTQNRQRLAPGESTELTVTMTAKDQPLLKSTVWLSVFLEGEGVSRLIPFMVIAYRRPSMVIEPKQLDFGVIDAVGDSVERTVRLEEVATDRFSVEGVEVGKWPIAYRLSETEIGEGLKRFVVHLSLDPKGLPPGEHKFDVVLRTRSVLRPEVRLPVRVNIRPDVQPAARTLVFAADAKSTPKQVGLVSTIAGEFSAEIIDVPEGWIANLVTEAKGKYLSVRPKNGSAASPRGVIRVQVVDARGKSYSLEIECVSLP